MASLVLKMSVSLDGYVAPVDGSTDWVAAGRSDDALRWTVETVSNAGAHLVGATTYAGWAGYWPSASGPFAKPMNEIPKVVFSDSLASADWGETTIAAGDLAEAIRGSSEERSDGYLLAPRRGTVRPIAGRDRLDRRVPPCHPPGRPGRGRADLHGTAHHRADRLPPSAAAPSLTSSRRTRDRARSATGSADAVTSRYDGPGKRLQTTSERSHPC